MNKILKLCLLAVVVAGALSVAPASHARRWRGRGYRGGWGWRRPYQNRRRYRGGWGRPYGRRAYRYGVRPYYRSYRWGPGWGGGFYGGGPGFYGGPGVGVGFWI